MGGAGGIDGNGNRSRNRGSRGSGGVAVREGAGHIRQAAGHGTGKSHGSG